mgnify:CR=1 FL=1
MARQINFVFNGSKLNAALKKVDRKKNLWLVEYRNQ